MHRSELRMQEPNGTYVLIHAPQPYLTDHTQHADKHISPHLAEWASRPSAVLHTL